jgi:hypothetical protein
MNQDSASTGQISKGFRLSVVVAIALFTPAVANGVMLGQVDTFQTLGANAPFEGWTDGHAGNDVANPSGGPAGAADNFLQISSGTFDTQPKLVSFNRAQWTGSFLAAGVSGVLMDLKNFGSSSLPIRIAIREGTGGSATPGYVSTTPFTLPADGQWHQGVFFSLAADSLTGVNSPQPLNTDLANVAEFRILAATSPSLIGSTLSGQIGVDNITAVPEPSGVVLVLTGLLVAMFRRCALGT